LQDCLTLQMFHLLALQGNQTTESCPLLEDYYAQVQDITEIGTAIAAVLSGLGTRLRLG
jgi:hypothetical protein